MSVLIRGVELPTSCPCELLGIGYDLYCSFVGEIPDRVKEYYECCQNDTRPSWCPLSPVPPHGRLIDADALIRDNGIKVIPEYYEVVCDAPTIIPAELAEEGKT